MLLHRCVGSILLKILILSSNQLLALKVLLVNLNHSNSCFDWQAFHKTSVVKADRLYAFTLLRSTSSALLELPITVAWAIASRFNQLGSFNLDHRANPLLPRLSSRSTLKPIRASFRFVVNLPTRSCLRSKFEYRFQEPSSQWSQELHLCLLPFHLLSIQAASIQNWDQEWFLRRFECRIHRTETL